MRNFFLILILEMMNIHSSFAVTRTVYFSQTGRNVTTNGIPTALTSTCTIKISNPSNQSQKYYGKIKVVSKSSTAALDGVNGGAVTGMTNNGGGEYEITSGSAVTITAGSENRYVLSFKAYPTTVTTGAQNNTCSGTITATDTSASAPGMLLASGVVTSFVESANVKTVGATGTAQFGGYAITNVIPLIINRGKPF